MKKLRNIKITRGISFSKARTTWICSWCEKNISINEESILVMGLERGDLSGRLFNKGIGARIHIKCLGEMCETLKDAEKNKEKYAIINSFEDKK